jgi:hypothetical protein
MWDSAAAACLRIMWQPQWRELLLQQYVTVRVLSMRVFVCMDVFVCVACVSVFVCVCVFA